MRRSIAFSLLALALVSIPAPAALQGQSNSRFYRIDDIGTLGVDEVSGLTINDNGDIAGYARLPSGEQHAFRYTDAGGMEDLGGASLGLFSQALGINNRGDVVGVFLDRNFTEHGFMAPAGSTMQDLLTEDRWIRVVTSITDDGRLAGSIYTSSGDAHPFRTLLDGTIHDLGTEGSRGMAWRMNTSGQVTGYETRANSAWGIAFRYRDSGGKVDLGTLGGLGSFGLAINSDNVIVGCASRTDNVSHAFRSREGAPLEDLGTLGGESSCAEGVNNRGEIVGWADLADRQFHAFVYTDREGMIDLQTVIPPNSGLWLTFARAINNQGQIVVESNTVAGLRTYRLTPVEKVDELPPVISSASVSPNVLWPPDGRTVAATVSVTVNDDVDPAPVCRIASVTAVESDVAAPKIQADAAITGDLTLALRARRHGASSRRYDAVVRCSDASGHVSTATVSVMVPQAASAIGRS